MAGKHDVYVFEDPETKVTFVRPATASGVAGAFFRFRNLTKGTLHLTFPDGLMKEGPKQKIPKGKSDKYRVSSKADGLYTYVAKVAKRGKKKRAKGESDPRIIIDA